MSTNAGPNLTQLAVDSLLRYRRDFFFAPIAATTNQLVASIDPSSAATVGTALTLATYANGLLQRRARLVTMTLTDASGGAGGLAITVRIQGQRWGQFVTELLTVTCVNGSATTSTSVNVYDEVTSITPTIITSAAVGDALVCGIDGTAFGLDFPIDNVVDVLSIVNTSTNTEAAQTAITASVVQIPSSTVSVAGASYIKGITLATTDRWEVRYLVSRKFDGSGVVGAWR